MLADTEDELIGEGVDELDGAPMLSPIASAVRLALRAWRVPPRSPSTSTDVACAGIPAVWHSVLGGLVLRAKQREALEAIAAGDDLLYVDRTGGGKSLSERWF